MDAGVADAGDFTLIGILRGFFDVSAATFKEKNGLSEASEFDGEQDAGGSRSDDADVGVLRVGRGAVFEIADHGAEEVPRRCCSSVRRVRW